MREHGRAPAALSSHHLNYQAADRLLSACYGVR